jgi:prepilin-type N-terminal cleavage/methylation domain-containing protein
MQTNRKEAFSLIETLAAIVIFAIATSLALGGYMYLVKNANKNDVQNELNNDAQNAIEQLKRDIRLSSMNEIHFFPENNPPYEAISFPIAEDSDDDGVIERDSDGKIIWDHTVIYYIKEGTPNELVRTVYTPRMTMEGDLRQQQLDTVADTGSVSGTANAANATSSVIFKNLLNWEISPSVGSFNCYSPTEIKERIGLGYFLLGPGSHDYKFTIAGKDDDSSGYNLGIDTLTVSPSYLPREAEDQSQTSYSGTAPTTEFVTSYSGLGRLYVDGSMNDSFTLTMDNDRWEETDFGGRYASKSNTVVKMHIDSITPPSADNVIELEGNKEIWEAEIQTGDYTPSTTTNLYNKVIRVLVRGASMVPGGNPMQGAGMKTKLRFAASPQRKLTIENVLIAESLSSNTVSLALTAGTETPVMFLNGASTDNFTLIPAGEIVESRWLPISIDPEKNYVVTYSIPDNAGLAPALWRDNIATNYGLPRCTHVATLPTGSSLSQATAASMVNWAGQPTNDLQLIERNAMIGLHSIFSSYAEYGVYTSDIIDTKQDSVTYSYIGCNAEVPSGTVLGFKVRSGGNPGLLNAPSFDSLPVKRVTSAPSWSSGLSSSDIGTGRYAQFQVIMDSSASAGRRTPRLRDTYISWEGITRMVELSGIFSKGPNYGNFSLSIDGKGLQSALVVDLEIYKSVRGHHGNVSTNTISSNVKAALTPRNSGL